MSGRNFLVALAQLIIGRWHVTILHQPIVQVWLGNSSPKSKSHSISPTRRRIGIICMISMNELMQIIMETTMTRMISWRNSSVLWRRRWGQITKGVVEDQVYPKEI
jgi:hypothetical protein